MDRCNLSEKRNKTDATVGLPEVPVHCMAWKSKNMLVLYLKCTKST